MYTIFLAQNLFLIKSRKCNVMKLVCALLVHRRTSRCVNAVSRPSISQLPAESSCRRSWFTVWFHWVLFLTIGADGAEHVLGEHVHCWQRAPHTGVGPLCPAPLVAPWFLISSIYSYHTAGQSHAP